MTIRPLIDLSTTIPTMLPEQFRMAAKQALEFATDPFGRLDNNPFISDAWLAVSTELTDLADRLEAHFGRVFIDDPGVLGDYYNESW